MAFGVRAAASTFRYDRFYGWDPTRNNFRKDWEITGRKFRIDRFTSIYHRPTRRRHFTFDASIALPDSRVITEINSGEIWLMAGSSSSEIWGLDAGQKPYDKVYAGHLSSYPSGGLARYYEAAVTGSGTDLGYVKLIDQAPCYMDLELRSDGRQEGVIEETTGQYFLNVSANVTLVDGDYINLGTEWYRISEPYIDGGFSMARAIRGNPNYVDMLYLLPSGDASGYDPETGNVNTGTISEKQVSGLLRKGDKEIDHTEMTYKDEYQIHIYERHIGFTPKVGDKITIYDATLEIMKVSQYTQHVQWVLEVRR